jgi:transposase
MPDECPECGSDDIDVSGAFGFEWECQECGHHFNSDDEDDDFDDE